MSTRSPGIVAARSLSPSIRTSCHASIELPSARWRTVLSSNALTPTSYVSWSRRRPELPLCTSPKQGS